MANRMNQKNLRRGTGGGTSYDPAAAYDPDTFDERIEKTRERHGSESTADDVGDELSKVAKAVDDLEAAVVDGDDKAAERLANGDYDTDPDDDTDAVEKAVRAVEDDDLPDLPAEDYSAVAADAVDDEPTRLRKSTDSVGDLSKAIDDAPDRHSEANTREADDAVDGNPRLVDPDD